MEGVRALLTSNGRSAEPGVRHFKKPLVGFAEIARPVFSRVSQAILRTSTPAVSEPTALGTLRPDLCLCFSERFLSWRIKECDQRVFAERPEPPLRVHKEVAGKDLAVMLNDEISTAGFTQLTLGGLQPERGGARVLRDHRDRRRAPDPRSALQRPHPDRRAPGPAGEPRQPGDVLDDHRVEAGRLDQQHGLARTPRHPA